MSTDLGALAVLAALAASSGGLARTRIVAIAEAAGAPGAGPALDDLGARGLVRRHGDHFRLTRTGVEELLRLYAGLERAVDPSAPRDGDEDAQSIPWLTTVRACWIDALSFNYAVPAAALAPLLPEPLEPEVHRGSAWLQVLVSSLRDLRPRGVPSLFGANFYQVSYRAAVRCRGRRGGYFTRSDTNNHVMRAIGNLLAEFRFHDFGAATMSMIRQGERLVVGIEPEAARPGGRFVGVIPTRPRPGPPEGSVWRSVDDLQEPLVECYDAFGVDRESGYVYILSIDRDPWHPVFVEPEDLYSEYFDTGPLGGSGARLDSVLHVRECEYRWRRLRRERFA